MSQPNNKQYRYIGGLRNRDGNVTWTVGVTAGSPNEALLALCRVFAEKLNRTVLIQHVGLVRRQDLPVAR